eukprot:TRINITY_DN2243_c0_g2_i1.p1 TRINITY_DN2243_c0_g2~~TRINITY_DN2243_c0_g2_i1.p1  ORF type:complete len:479 (-),score=81.00 TRINITY_DN2243_c0_g2_i1:390-1826(-)
MSLKRVLAVVHAAQSICAAHALGIDGASCADADPENEAVELLQAPTAIGAHDGVREEAPSDGPSDGEYETVAGEIMKKDLEKISLPRRSTSSPVEVNSNDFVSFLRETFSRLMQASGYDLELNPVETRMFETRFVDALKRPVEDEEWSQAVLSAFRMMRPVVSQAEVARINGKSLGWSAKHMDWMLHTSVHDFQSRLGKSVPEGYKERLQAQSSEFPRGAITLPSDFDSRVQWPFCKSQIGRVLNQGHCGSCWAFGSMSAVDSRLCIATNGSWSGSAGWLSRGYVASCAIQGHDGCQGGLASYALDLLSTGGAPTASCSPYFAEGAGTEHFQQTGAAPACPGACHKDYARTLTSDLFILKNLNKYEELWNNENSTQRVKEALFQSGPLSFGFYASEVFMAYESGIFSHPTCDTYPNHEVFAIGWGSQPKPHFIAQNSWGTEWGDEGRFLVAECGPTDFTLPGDIVLEESVVPMLAASQ